MPISGATIMVVLMAPPQGNGESQTSRIMVPLAACGKEKEVTEEMVDGRKVLEEQMEEAGVKLLL